jgi:hypothetical protein
MQCQFYSARRLDAIEHGTLGPRGIAALEQHTISAGLCLKIMDSSADWLYTEDRFENCFGSLHSSIPTRTSATSKSCVGGVAVSCGTITTTNNSTTAGCASQTPAGTILLLVLRVLRNSDSPVISC